MTLILSVIVLIQATVFATLKLPPHTLEERVSEAALIFVGKLTNKQVNGDWVEAELVVKTPIAGVTGGEKIKVVWRATIKGRAIYDVKEGIEGVAILKDKHKGRYWLRADKFENLEQEKRIISLRKAVEDRVEDNTTNVNK